MSPAKVKDIVRKAQEYHTTYAQQGTQKVGELQTRMYVNTSALDVYTYLMVLEGVLFTQEVGADERNWNEQEHGHKIHGSTHDSKAFWSVGRLVT